MTAHPVEGERLRINHVKGPTLFQNLQLVNGVQISSFSEVAVLQGLLE